MNNDDSTIRMGRMALMPLAILHDDGWGPDAIEVDEEEGEVKFVFKNALEDDDG